MSGVHSTKFLLQNYTPTSYPYYTDWYNVNSENWTIQAGITGTGTVEASIEIEVTNDENFFITAGTIDLSDTESDSGGFSAQNSPWYKIRSKIVSSSGTDHKISIVLGV